MECRAKIHPTSIVPKGCVDAVWPEGVTIGANCVLSLCSILSYDASRLPSFGKYLFKRTTIGDSCFIGLHAVILPGVTIGKNCIVGAGAVVTKDVEDGLVVAGVPAKAIGKTFDVADNIDFVDSPWGRGPYGDLTDSKVTEWMASIKNSL